MPIADPEPAGGNATRRRQRQKARKGLVQALYSMDLEKCWEDQRLVQNLGRLDPALAPDSLSWGIGLGQSILEHKEKIDQFLDQVNAGWRLSRFGVVERSIMRIGVAELWYTDTPELVSISEGVRLTELFAEKKAVALVHAILDRAREEKTG